MKKLSAASCILITFAVSLYGGCEGKKVTPEIKLETTANPPGGKYRRNELPFFVTLSSSKKATIYYTLDGSAPLPGRDTTFSAPSPVTGIEINGPTTLRYFAEDEEGNRESVKTEVYEIDEPPETVALPPGGRFADNITVTLSASEPATIYYTMDGTDPTPEHYDNTCANSCQVKITCPETEEECTTILKFFAIDQSDIEEETIHQETYIIDRKKPTTYITPPGGHYDGPQSVQLLTDEPAIIYYCINGGVPSTQPENFIENGGCTYRAENSAAIEVNDHTILRYFAVDEVGNQEDMHTQIYRIGDAPIAVLDPPPGLYNYLPFVVTVTSSPQPATFYYTLDGTDVTIGSSSFCNTPCTFTITNPEANVVKYIITDGVNHDKQREALYILDITPPTTTADPAGGYYDSPISVTISANEDNVTVYYTVIEGQDGCSTTPPSSALSKAKAPVKNISIYADSAIYYYGVDLAGNQENAKCEEYSIYGRFTEDFSNDTYIDTANTDAEIDYVKTEVHLSIDRPEVVNTLPLNVVPQAMAVSGKYLLAAGGAQGILVFDISMPDDPVYLDSYLPELGRTYISLKFYGRYLLAGWTTPTEIGVDLIDAANPSVLVGANPPSPITSYTEPADTGKAPVRIEVINDHVLVAMGTPGAGTWSSRLVSLITDYSSILDYVTEVNNLSYHPYYALLINGDFAFGGSVDGWVDSFSIKNLDAFPNSPSDLVSLDGPVYDMVMKEGYILALVDAGSTSRLRIINATDPTAMNLLSNYLEFNADTPYRIVLNGATAYIASSARLLVLDVRNPSSPVKLVEMDAPGCRDLVIVGEYAYCAGLAAELITLRIGERSALSSVKEWDAGSTITKIGLSGDYLYAITSGAVSLLTTDLETIYSIGVSGATGFSHFGMDIYNRNVGVVASSSGLQYFNLENTAPIWITSAAIGRVDDLVIDGDMIYTASGDSGCGIYDASEVFSPSLSAVFSIVGESCLDVLAAGPELLTLFNASGLYVVDVRTPSSPAQMGTYNTSGNPQTMGLEGNMLVVADGLGGAVTLDITNRYTPQLLSTTPTSNAKDVEVFGFTAYLADGSGGLKSINLTIPDTPLIDRSLSLQDSRSIAFDGEYIYVTDGARLLKVNSLKPLASYRPTGTVTSLNINSSGLNVKKGRIQIDATIPDGTSVTLYLSNDGGTNWLQVYQGQFVTFPNLDADLRWKAVLKTNDPRKTPVIRSVTVVYYYE